MKYCLFFCVKLGQTTCPGNLVYQAEGAPFVPSCSNPNPQVTNQDMTSSCVCPDGEQIFSHLAARIIYMALFFVNCVLRRY